MPSKLEKERLMANISPRTDHDIHSPVRAYQIVESLKTLWNSKSSQLKFWTRQLAELIENKAWLLIPVDEPYGNPETMMEKEVGCTVDEFVAFMKLVGIDADLLYEVDKALHDKPTTRVKPETIAKAQQARQLYEELGSQKKVAEKMEISPSYVRKLLKGEHQNPYIISQTVRTQDTEYGTASRYAVERLRRAGEDELAKSVLSGKQSARAALETAGIKITKSISLSFKPDESGGNIASKLYQKLSDEQLKQLLENLLNYFDKED